jgi:hypothetical protein
VQAGTEKREQLSRFRPPAALKTQQMVLQIEAIASASLPEKMGNLGVAAVRHGFRVIQISGRFGAGCPHS